MSFSIFQYIFLSTTRDDEEGCRLSVCVAQLDGDHHHLEKHAATRDRDVRFRDLKMNQSMEMMDRVRSGVEEISRREATEGADPEQLDGSDVGQQRNTRRHWGNAVASFFWGSWGKQSPVTYCELLVLSVREIPRTKAQTNSRVQVPGAL